MQNTSNKNLIKLHISQLKQGMFVSELDVGWLKTHFAVQGMMINSQKDIDAIADYATFVWIDPLRQAPNSLDQLRTIVPSESVKKVSAKSVITPTKQADKIRKIYPTLNAAADEHRVAKRLYSQGKTAIKNILTRVTEQNDIAIEDARSVVNECMESVIRNPDALMWMSKIREQDEYTAEHCLNVCILAMVFGRHLGLPEKEIIRLGLCGLLHDVGKMKMPSEILNKPDKLNSDEFDVIKNHTLTGYNLLMASSNFIPPIVAEVAKSHHEKIDGTGYPFGVNANNLDRMVLMISLVDAYDAMTSDRCYSKGKSNTDALKLIYEQKGKQFDEELALEFIRCIGIYPAGSIIQLMNGSVGIVIEINVKYRHLPKVLVLVDHEGNKINPYYLNLLEVEMGVLNSDCLIRRTLKNGAYGIDVSEYIAPEIKS